jgi:hypothetical protein
VGQRHAQRSANQNQRRQPAAGSRHGHREKPDDDDARCCQQGSRRTRPGRGNLAHALPRATNAGETPFPALRPAAIALAILKSPAFIIPPSRPVLPGLRADPSDRVIARIETFLANFMTHRRTVNISRKMKMGISASHRWAERLSCKTR